VLPKFEQFIKERQYVTNVSASTVEWYEQSLKWLNIESPTETDIKALVMRMRDSGLKAMTCNCRLACHQSLCSLGRTKYRCPKAERAAAGATDF